MQRDSRGIGSVFVVLRAGIAMLVRSLERNQRNTTMLRTTLLLLAATLAAEASLQPIHAQTSLPNSVAAGEVTSHGALVWARATVPGFVRVRVAHNPQFQGPVIQRWGFAFGPLQAVKVLVNPLEAGRTYYYEVRDAAGLRETGRFRTAPRHDSRAGLRFGVTGDARGDVMPFGSLSNVESEALDFLVLLGDTIYADVESPALPGVTQARTLDEFRAKHAEVYGAVNGVNGLGDARRSTAVLATIDDHEVTNDFAGGAAPSTDPRFDPTGSFINDTNLYRNGLRAFLEFNPLIPRFYGPTSDARTAFQPKLYRAQRYGLDAALFLLDARSFRDRELPGANPTDPASVLNFLVSAFDPSRTLLGRAQVNELKQDLLEAQSAGVVWKFVIVPEPIQNLGVLAASDRFEGYAAERTELLSFITTNAIRNVVFVSADIHGTLVNDVSFQAGPGQPQIPTGAFEITTGPIAYDAPFGPTVAGLAAALGLLTPQQFAFYSSLPTPAKDAFVRGLVDQQLAPLGYSPLGLEGSTVPATLLQGSYVATHVYGWSEFEIAPTTGVLTVTTWGVDPANVLATPSVVSRFQVQPQ